MTLNILLHAQIDVARDYVILVYQRFSSEIIQTIIVIHLTSGRVNGKLLQTACQVVSLQLRDDFKECEIVTDFDNTSTHPVFMNLEDHNSM